MGKSAGSPPAPPSAVETASAQTTSNIETARANATLNRVNQTTPYGSVTYSHGGSSQPWDEAGYLAANPDVTQAIENGYYKTGLEHFNASGKNENRQGVAAGYDPGAQDRWSADVRLSPEQQHLYDQSIQGRSMYGDAALSQLSTLKDRLSKPVDFSGMPAMGQTYDNSPEQRNRVEAALFGRLNPSLETQRTGLETRLRNQGLTPGSEAWSTAMRDQSQSENDARLGVTAAGGREQALQGDLAHQVYGEMMGQRGQAEQEMLQQRSIPLNELAALLGGQQVNYPQFVNPSNSQQGNTDVLSAFGMQQSGAQAKYNANAANAQAGNAAATSAAIAAATIAASALAASDRRVKEDVERVGETDDGQDLYFYRYKGDPEHRPHVGLMAQDVEKRNPDAVVTIGGVKHVDYVEALFGGQRRARA